MAGLLIAMGTLGWWQVAQAPPAQACSCVILTDDEVIQRADIIAEVSVAVDYTGASSNQAHYLLNVIKVWKGQHAAQVDMTTNRQEAACGLGERSVGDQFLLWGVAQSDGSYAASGCLVPAPTTDVPALLADRFDDPWTPTRPTRPGVTPSKPRGRLEVSVGAGVVAALGIGGLGYAWFASRAPRRR